MDEAALSMLSPNLQTTHVHIEVDQFPPDNALIVADSFSLLSTESSTAFMNRPYPSPSLTISSVRRDYDSPSLHACLDKARITEVPSDASYIENQGESDTTETHYIIVENGIETLEPPRRYVVLFTFD